MEPVLHVVKDLTDWPPQVSTISHLFFRPLPNYVVTKARERREFLSLGLWELYEEALSSPLLAVGDEDTTEPPTITVIDVIDSILSAVRMVKVASSVNTRQGNKQAQLSWISVLTQLGIGISEDIIILENAAFLRARMNEKTVVTGAEDVVGRSSLLLATLLNRPVDKTDASDAVMKIDEMEHEIRSCNYSTASEASSDALGIPFDTHILPGCGKRVNCLLPVVCVAPEQEIKALVTSVVCQRYALDITLPVVGISLPASGTTTQIFLGWAEGKGDDSDSMPAIHIAYASGANIHTSVGVFDLLDPASVLYFAQFILQLQPHFLSIKESSLRVRSICWRLDHFRDKQCPDSSTNHLSRIVDWIRGLSADIAEAVASDINNQSSTHIMASRNPRSNTQSKPSSSSQFLQVTGSQSSRSRSRQRSAQQSSSSSNFLDTNEGGGSDSDSSATGITASYYPASSFAKLGLKTGAQERWLWERRTIRLFRVDYVDPDSNLKAQVCEMIREYNFMIQSTWPTSWDRFSNVPSRDPVHESIRHQLFESYKDHKNRHSNFPPMEDEVFHSIKNHISALYRAVANARASQHQAKVKEAKEASLRSSWDELLKAVCCDVDSASSTCVIVETSIPLPRNKASELGSAFGADVQALIPQHILVKQLSASPPGSTVPDAIRVALTVSYLHAQTSRPSKIVGPGDRKYEPATATVDAICYLQYKIPMENRDPAGRTIKKGEETPKTTKQKDKPEGWMSKFMKMVSPLSSMNKPCKGRSPDKLPPSISRKGPGARHATCYMCPFVTESLDLPSSCVSSSDPIPHTEIHIPYFYAEYKRDPSDDRQAFHQAQMYVTFGVEYLAALGIKDAPVWALVTSGTTGSIIMAWKSTKEKAPNPNSATTEYNFIIDQYVRSFDISQPLEALQLMACLRRIYQRGLDLQARLQQLNPTMFTNPSAAILDRMMPPRSESKDKESTDKRPKDVKDKTKPPVA